MNGDNTKLQIGQALPLSPPWECPGREDCAVTMPLSLSWKWAAFTKVIGMSANRSSHAIMTLFLLFLLILSSPLK